MKTREGFVTNSSSSSFIVTFDKVPECECELREMLFGNSQIVGYFDYNFTTRDIAEVVFRDMKAANDYEKIFEEFSYDGDRFDGAVNIWDVCSDIEDDTERGECWNKYAQHNYEISLREFEKFKEANKDKFTFVFEYEDHSDLGATLEHGGIFDNVQHIRINKH